MFRNTFYIGRFFGIPVRIHVSWLIIFVLLTWSLSGIYFPGAYKGWSSELYWVVGVVTSLLFFSSVLAHELAHSVLARRRGLRVHDIVLFIFGGVSQIAEESKSAGTEFLVAVVGPLTSVVLGVLFSVLGIAMAQVSPPVAAVGIYLGYINLLLAVFNMLPGYPLDGGRVLRAILWRVTGDVYLSTRWAARVGQGLAYLFILLGITRVFFGDVVGGLWIAFIGWFLENAALSSYRQVQLRHTLAQFHVEDVMMRDYPTVASDAPLAPVVDEYFLRVGLRCVPVTSADRLAGLLTVRDVHRLSRDAWQTTQVGQVMVPIESVKTTGPGDNLWDALVRMTAEEVNQMPVVADGRLEGMLTRGGILRFMRTRAELGL